MALSIDQYSRIRADPARVRDSRPLGTLIRITESRRVVEQPVLGDRTTFLQHAPQICNKNETFGKVREYIFMFMAFLAN